MRELPVSQEKSELEAVIDRLSAESAAELVEYARRLEAQAATRQSVDPGGHHPDDCEHPAQLGHAHDEEP